jgi:hypothetical protein
MAVTAIVSVRSFTGQLLFKSGNCFAHFFFVQVHKARYVFVCVGQYKRVLYPIEGGWCFPQFHVPQVHQVVNLFAGGSLSVHTTKPVTLKVLALLLGFYVIGFHAAHYLRLRISRI